VNRMITALAAIGVLVPDVLAHSQQLGLAPDQARDLVVKVDSRFAVPSGGGRTDTTDKSGAGVIVGVDGDRIYIATAKHVVRARDLAFEVLVGTRRDETGMLATIADTAPGDIDLAVLTIPRASLRQLPALDRRGDPAKLRFNDPVSPMGCPNGNCWGVPAPPDRMVGIVGRDLVFQSFFVGPGSSGGALFNQYWEVVGVVTGEEPPRANALAIDVVLGLMRAMQHPVSLRRAKVPRAGYPIHVGALLLTPLSSSSGPSDRERRFPSGRIVATRKGELYGLTWHLSGLRLVPRNLAVTAGMGGVDLGFRWGPITAQPFFEVGLGRVEGRYDAQGYNTIGGHVYNWQQKKQDGLGLGGGMSLLATVAPHLTLEVMGAHWSFNRPDSIPALPAIFGGAGLRWGL
jgi:Trypsin-like peptidase domain